MPPIKHYQPPYYMLNCQGSCMKALVVSSQLLLVGLYLEPVSHTGINTSIFTTWPGYHFYFCLCPKTLVYVSFFYSIISLFSLLY